MSNSPWQQISDKTYSPFRVQVNLVVTSDVTKFLQKLPGKTVTSLHSTGHCTLQITVGVCFGQQQFQQLRLYTEQSICSLRVPHQQCQKKYISFPSSSSFHQSTDDPEYLHVSGSKTQNRADFTGSAGPITLLTG